MPFPDHLKGLSKFTQADLTQLRQVGCDVTFLSVEEGVSRYLAQLNSADQHPTTVSAHE